MRKAQPADHERSYRFTLVLTDTERAKLGEAARQKGISRADVLRGTLANYPTPRTPRAKRGE